MGTEIDIGQGVILDEQIQVTLLEMTRICGTASETLLEMVAEGLLAPSGSAPENWRFSGPQIRRAQRAVRLARDLELNLAGTALTMHLLDELEALRARISFLEHQLGRHRLD